MNHLFRSILFLPVIFISCRQGGDNKNGKNEPGSTKNAGPELQTITSEFPAFELDELVDEISQDELETVVTDGESENWKTTTSDPLKGELKIQSKQASDNSVRFKLYRANSRALLGVQQQNAQVSVTELWEYRYEVDGDHPERWNQYLISEYKIDSFFNEKVILPNSFRGTAASPYLDYEFSQKGLAVSLNKWAFMRDLESQSIAPEGPLDPALIKYKYFLTWNGVDFSEEKVKEAGYEDLITFTTNVFEPDPGGPGVHEFDCPHGVSVIASSTLKNQGAVNYRASNMLDPAESTAWSEAVDGGGEGEWVEFTITKGFVIGNTWQISNGYSKNKTSWEDNNRVKKLKVIIDDTVVGYVMLANVSTYQSFTIQPGWIRDPVQFKKGTKIRFVIEEIYKGARYDDTVISYFVPTGNCG